MRQQAGVDAEETCSAAFQASPPPPADDVCVMRQVAFELVCVPGTVRALCKDCFGSQGNCSYVRASPPPTACDVQLTRQVAFVLVGCIPGTVISSVMTALAPKGFLCISNCPYSQVPLQSERSDSLQSASSSHQEWPCFGCLYKEKLVYRQVIICQEHEARLE